MARGGAGCQMGPGWAGPLGKGPGRWRSSTTVQSRGETGSNYSFRCPVALDVHPQTDKQKVLHPHNGVSFSQKKEPSADTRYNTNLKTHDVT